jgi:hypothetical protein|tara:strand:- start:174 stop:752 length:579 start_codon:yes stop_codon:yes gene_type:complete
MSFILYYSNFCENCKQLLQTLAKSTKKEEVHFICIDKRTQKNNGATYVILENGQEMILPPTITKVPALLLLNQGHKVLFGSDINDVLKHEDNSYQQPVIHKSQVNVQSEPMAFAMGNGLGGVASDNFSFLDQTADSMTAKGDGGMRQMHNYVALNNQGNTIETPSDDYTPDKIGEVSLDQLQQKRNMDIKNK